MVFDFRDFSEWFRQRNREMSESKTVAVATAYESCSPCFFLSSRFSLYFSLPCFLVLLSIFFISRIITREREEQHNGCERKENNS